MPDLHSARTVKILIASPSDVAKERDVAEKVIRSMKITCENNIRLVLEPVRWEMDVPSQMGKPAQDVINRYVDECDCAVCMFWMRIGTETRVAPGGAVEEFERMLNAKKPVMLYFSRCPVDDPLKIDPDQLKKLKEWRDALGSRGVSKEYNSIDKFETILTRELEQLLRQEFCAGSYTEKGKLCVVAPEQYHVAESYQRYREALRNQFRMLVSRGFDDYQDIEIPLEDIFIDLHITDQHGFGAGRKRMHEIEFKKLSQNELLNETFHGKHSTNVVLLIGDPGSGKTTLLQHYAMLCLNGCHQELFPDAAAVRIVFIELRKLAYDESKNPLRLAEQVVRRNSTLSLRASDVEHWWDLGDKKVPLLVLLDGLDEVTELEKRQNICEWIDEEARSYTNRFFVVTSRRTGYMTSQGVELTGSHRRATVQDFEVKQQRDFLLKWFAAASEFEKERGFYTAGEKAPEEQATELFHYLYPVSEDFDENIKKGLQELAGIPLLLKLMALLYKMRGFRPESRIGLYRVSLGYLLRGRDRVRKISGGINPEQATSVLSLLAYTMHRENRIEQSADWMKRTMEERFARQNTGVSLKSFFEIVVDRGGILVPYGDVYRFRHKTYQEYLASMEMVRCSRSDDFIRSIILHYGDEEWEWDETLRFYFSQIEADVFDVFMDKLFVPDVSTDMLARKLQLMKTMIRESKECSIAALCRKLEDPELPNEVKWYVLDCLKTIGKTEALEALYDFKKKQPEYYGVSWDQKTDEYKKIDHMSDKLEEVIASLESVSGDTKNVIIKAERETVNLANHPPSFRNPYEHDAQYILIRGGSYVYSDTKEEAIVQDLYVAKYPVTNRQYRSFVDFLAGKPPESSSNLSLKSYQEALFALANSKDSLVTRFDYYLKKEKDLVALFRSGQDDDRKFNKDDQPVVGVSWYAARAYCLWLSLVESGGKETELYRLPTEWEWEWAAGGRSDKPDEVLKVRKYPWGDRPEPTAKHANYDENEGETTPVGSYPDGATSEGLYDMAGNVLEWMENWYDNDEDWKSLRGGSWSFEPVNLECSFRDYYFPDYWYFSIGFRVVRPSPPVK